MKSMQVVAVVLVVAASLVAGTPQYHPGYPYPGAPGYPYAPGVHHGLPAPVHDTPEVAAAKAAHFAAYNAAASGAPAAVPGVYPGAPGYPYGAHGYPYAPVAPHGLPAPVQDTPEVAAAKAAHAAAHAAAGAHHYG